MENPAEIEFGRGLGQWVYCQTSDSRLKVYARFEQAEDGRLKLVDVVVLAPEGEELTVRDLRSVPLAVITSTMSNPELADVYVEEAQHHPEPDIRGLLHRMNHQGAIVVHGQKPVPLVVPRKPPYSSEFYRQVAEHYRYWIGMGEPNPVERIHRALPPQQRRKTKVSTVHSWIKRAREAGALGPAPGKGRRGG